MKELINEIHRFKKIAGLLREEEDIDLSDTPQFKRVPKVPREWGVEVFDKEFDPNDPLRATLTFPAEHHPDNEELQVYVFEDIPGKYYIQHYDGIAYQDDDTVYDNFDDALKAAVNMAYELSDNIAYND